MFTNFVDSIILITNEVFFMENNKMHETQTFNNLEKSVNNEAKRIVMQVYSALKEKGYNPVNQIVGYILSGDPTYITSHNNARSLVVKLERDELLEEVVTFYVNYYEKTNKTR